MKKTESKTQHTAEGIIYTPAKYSRKPNALDWYCYYDSAADYRMIYGSTKDYPSKEAFLIEKCGKSAEDAPFLTESVFLDKNYTASEMRDLQQKSNQRT